MQVISRFGKQRRHMTGRTLRRAIEDSFAAPARSLVKRPLRRVLRRQGELIELQRGQCACDQVRIVTEGVVAKLVRERILLAVETWIEEGPLPAHLGIR